MNLQRLVSYFEIWGRAQHGAGPVLAFDDAGAFGRLGALRLDSHYQPLFDRQRQVIAYEALLRVSDPQRRRIAPDRFFAALDDSYNVIGVDRLCRVIHSVNFITQQPQQQSLYLNVNGRHLLGIASGRHGATFEALLADCGLRPAQVVLEIIESSVEDLGLLQQAIAAYKSKGFRIAIDDFGARHSNFDRLWALEPDIVKLDRSLIVQAVQNPRAAKVLPMLVRLIQELGAKVVCEGIETVAQQALALDAGADMLQGFLYGQPAPALLSVAELSA